MWQAHSIQLFTSRFLSPQLFLFSQTTACLAQHRHPTTIATQRYSHPSIIILPSSSSFNHHPSIIILSLPSPS
jgi:hypothetical protein